jgi:hypothetical protein
LESLMKKQFSDLVKRLPSRSTPTKSQDQSNSVLQEECVAIETSEVDVDIDTNAVSDVVANKNSNSSSSSSGSMISGSILDLDPPPGSPSPPLREGGILTAVRIRPLNTREVGSNSRVVVSSPGFMSQSIQIINPIFFKSSTQTEKLRKLEERGFSFDHTFWSLDGEHGVDNDEYASQEDIYEKIGKPIIQNAMSGFNSSLFAYGKPS